MAVATPLVLLKPAPGIDRLEKESGGAKGGERCAWGSLDTEAKAGTAEALGEGGRLAKEKQGCRCLTARLSYYVKRVGLASPGNSDTPGRGM